MWPTFSAAVKCTPAQCVSTMAQPHWNACPHQLWPTPCHCTKMATFYQLIAAEKALALPLAASAGSRALQDDHFSHLRKKHYKAYVQDHCIFYFLRRKADALVTEIASLFVLNFVFIFPGIAAEAWGLKFYLTCGPLGHIDYCNFVLCLPLRFR